MAGEKPRSRGRLAIVGEKREAEEPAGFCPLYELLCGGSEKTPPAEDGQAKSTVTSEVDSAMDWQI